MAKKAKRDKLTPDQEKKLKQLESMGFSPEPGWEKYISTELGTPAASADVQKIYDAVTKMIHKEPAPKKADPKKAANATSMTADQALQELGQYLASNAVTQGELGMAGQAQNLAQQNQYVTGLVDQQMQMAGAASGNPAIAAAMGAYSNAYNTGEAINSMAYTNMGQANAQYLGSAQLQPIVNLLTQGFGSTQYKELPTNVVQSLPQSLRQALSAAGVTQANPQGGSGGTPIPTGTTPGGANNFNVSALINSLSANNAGNPNTGLGQTLNPGNSSAPGA